MTRDQLIKKIYPLYLTNFGNFESFQQAIVKLEEKNEDTARYFMIASLRLVESESFQKSHPVVANLLVYIAVETLCNNLAYFKETNGIKNTDFRVNCQIEKKINKTQEFQKFLNDYCSDSLKQKISFKKCIDEKEVDSSFNDVLRYLYQRNRCVIVHKGLFRNIEENTSQLDIFIDEDGEKCFVSIDFPDGCLTTWIYQVSKESFVSFFVQNIGNE